MALKHMVDRQDADGIRASLRPSEYPQEFHPDQYPPFEGHGVLKIATGRATCRSCGLRITKGEYEIHFLEDFHGNGSWTAVDCHIHAERCENPRCFQEGVWLDSNLYCSTCTLRSQCV